MPELINANPTVLSASAIPSRATKSTPDPFQDLLTTTHTAPEEWNVPEDDGQPEGFDPQEIYGTPPIRLSLIDCRLTEYHFGS